MNVHHLELFFYVARYGGITEAVRNIPYSIQQPAVSGQIIQLEQFLGVTLFQRRPFELTPPGRELYEFVAPFFGNIETMAAKLQGGVLHQVRIGASEIILREHLPIIVQNVRKKFPNLKIVLRESNQPQLESWLERGEIDLAITLLQEKSPPGLCSQPLLSLPLILLVHKSNKLKSAEELWKRDKIDEPLITLPPNEVACRQFQAGLSRLNIDWFPTVEVSSLNLVEAYVATGYGIGLSVRIPKTKLSSEVRALDLPDFPNMTVGILYRGKTTPLIQMFLREVQQRARQI